MVVDGVRVRFRTIPIISRDVRNRGFWRKGNQVEAGAEIGDIPDGTPSGYAAGCRRAARIDPVLARRYAQGTMERDPPADQAVSDLARAVPSESIHATIAACMSGDGELPPEAPESLRALIEDARRAPPWYDPEVARVAGRAFLRNAHVVLLSLVSAAIVEGFSTGISKAFQVRGRLVDNGLQRLVQNNRQLFEQFLPGGMEPGGDGWRATLRVRLVHAQARSLIAEFGNWPVEQLGTPVHASHVALGCAAFSGRLMRHAMRLGGDFTAEEREAYVHVWRRSAELLGVPEHLAFSDMDSALRLFEVAVVCEPAPDHDSIMLANSIINSAPLVFGYTAPAARRKWAARLYEISRALIGDEAATALAYPSAPRRLVSPLRSFRWKKRLARILGRVTPPAWHGNPFLQTPAVVMMRAIESADYDLRYALPTALHDEDSESW